MARLDYQLSQAILNNHLEYAESLIKDGAKLDYESTAQLLKNNANNTLVLDLALSHNFISSIECILDYGVNSTHEELLSLFKKQFDIKAENISLTTEELQSFYKFAFIMYREPTAVLDLFQNNLAEIFLQREKECNNRESFKDTIYHILESKGLLSDSPYAAIRTNEERESFNNFYSKAESAIKENYFNIYEIAPEEAKAKFPIINNITARMEENIFKPSKAFQNEINELEAIFFPYHSLIEIIKSNDYKDAILNNKKLIECNHKDTYKLVELELKENGFDNVDKALNNGWNWSPFYIKYFLDHGAKVNLSTFADYKFRSKYHSRETHEAVKMLSKAYLKQLHETATSKELVIYDPEQIKSQSDYSYLKELMEMAHMTNQGTMYISSNYKDLHPGDFCLGNSHEEVEYRESNKKIEDIYTKAAKYNDFLVYHLEDLENLAKKAETIDLNELTEASTEMVLFIPDDSGDFSNMSLGEVLSGSFSLFIQTMVAVDEIWTYPCSSYYHAASQATQDEYAAYKSQLESNKNMYHDNHYTMG